jgi:hypothetical protein
MRRSQRPARKFAGLFISLVVAAACSGISREDSAQLAKIRNDLQTGFSNGGWNLDRYPELEPLKAGARITVADLPGPGIIRHIHTTRHRPAEVFARGIVLEIWFDDADSPAVMSPLADFFGDGCNGRSMDFSAELIECAPWSYNCYFVMPFKERARVFLRNDTGRDATNYSYVEWEKIPRWDETYGYFHATYRRTAFRLLEDTSELFFEATGVWLPMTRPSRAFITSWKATTKSISTAGNGPWITSAARIRSPSAGAFRKRSPAGSPGCPWSSLGRTAARRACPSIGSIPTCPSVFGDLSVGGSTGARRGICIATRNSWREDGTKHRRTGAAAGWITLRFSIGIKTPREDSATRRWTRRKNGVPSCCIRTVPLFRGPEKISCPEAQKRPRP